MFTDLALIDWIALAFSAVLLAAAAAAATIAYATSTHRSKRQRSSMNSTSFVRSTRTRSTAQHVIGSTNTVEPESSPSPTSVQVDEGVLAPVFVSRQETARSGLRWHPGIPASAL